ncbi:Predicted amidohydrolase [Tistlia consotensis]|uniref:Predicted amidohydrolase n=1 Tax=Tistlia consotensis USBA 355 TaxID=560819 RepID=A0A1Y6B626_9PROT|nr:N-carbamoyl-D-amino-acid hydrolase [Tistlia consotensis]SME92662.1 Predicted amidohydrolase [Tistlia consotensis USBA 355]SNR28169.1 Predicted amidohydrolase [Tistlia consotensis]
MSRTRIFAVGQLGPISLADSKEAAVARLIALLREAHGRGAVWITFPELALTTFFPRYVYDDPADYDRFFEEGLPSPAMRPLFEVARELGIGFYLGFAEKVVEGGETHRYNTAILVERDGRVIGKYRKIHLPGTRDPIRKANFEHLEKRYFEVGDLGFRSFGSSVGRIGLCICNDRRWPETFRVMALQGAEVFLLGYNTPTLNIHHPEPAHLREFHNRLSLESAAYQNAAWVMAAAKCGAEDGFAMIGGSAIVAPTGETVARASGEDDEVISYACDLELGAYIRRSVFDFARHRRIEHYGLIASQTGIVIPEDEPAAGDAGETGKAAE